jgi:hypothetical protein
MLTEDVENLEAEEQSKDDNQQAGIEKAFVSSNGKRELGDLIVQPWTPDREVAAQAMGLHFGYVDKSGINRFSETNLYPGAVRDVAIVMWLCCSATKDEIYSAGVSPRVATDKAIEWAAKEGLTDAISDEFEKAYGYLFEMLTEVRISRSKAEKKIPTTTQDQK